jgi:hypothetical protein
VGHPQAPSLLSAASALAPKHCQLPLCSNLLLSPCVLITSMDTKGSLVAIAANYLIIAGLLFYGFALFAEYYARGRWAKNVTGLLAGLGMLALAAALLFVPQNADELARIAHHTDAANVFLGISSGLLLAAIAAFGIITYTKPLRLWHERKIESDLERGLPKIP